MVNSVERIGDSSTGVLSHGERGRSGRPARVIDRGVGYLAGRSLRWACSGLACGRPLAAWRQMARPAGPQSGVQGRGAGHARERCWLGRTRPGIPPGARRADLPGPPHQPGDGAADPSRPAVPACSARPGHLLAHVLACSGRGPAWRTTSAGGAAACELHYNAHRPHQSRQQRPTRSCRDGRRAACGAGAAPEDPWRRDQRIPPGRVSEVTETRRSDASRHFEAVQAIFGSGSHFRFSTT